jgi:hypothetical protein
VSASPHLGIDHVRDPAPSRAWRRIILQFAPLAWLGVFAFELLNMESWRIANTEFMVAPPAMRAVQYLLMLPLLLLACRAAVAVGLAPRWRAGRVLVQILLGIGFAATSRPALVTASWLLGARDASRMLLESLLLPTREAFAVWVASSAATALNYAVCLGIVVAIKGYRDLEGERIARSEVERQATQARLQALTNQLNPHFLFNVLNTIVSLIETSPRLAQTLVTRFADLLRRILNAGEATFIPLGRELELVEQYVQIQQMRFPRRLLHSTRIDPSAVDALVPALLLQPIIENAVLHGLRSHGPEVHVQLEAAICDHALQIRVSNPGPARTDDTEPPRQGIGLRNVAERLNTLFGPRASVTLEANAPDRYVATLIVPLLTGEGPPP